MRRERCRSGVVIVCVTVFACLLPRFGNAIRPHGLGESRLHAETIPTRIDTVRLDSPRPGMQMALIHEHRRTAGRTTGAIVLFAEGSTIATAGNAGYRIDGESWMDDLAAHGADVWSLDYLGYGASDHYPLERLDSLTGTAADCAQQLLAATRFILRRQHATRLSLIGDSFGTLSAGLAVTLEPQLFRSLVLFAPVTAATAIGTGKNSTPLTPFDLVTPLDFWIVYRTWVPRPGAGLDSLFFAGVWGRTVLATDPTSVERTPPSILVPSGPDLDVRNAGAGRLAFDPNRIIVPTLVLRGEWDSIATTPGTQRLFDSLAGAPWKRMVVIAAGTHLVQLEHERHQVFREVEAFVRESGEGR
jgi:pimeloyl-ACP methyl ester carboxylesterase